MHFVCFFAVGEIRVLLTHNWWPEISSALSLAPLTLRNFTAVLAQHVSILDCGVYAYMSLEHDLVVLIAPNQKQPTYIQVRTTQIGLPCKTTYPHTNIDNTNTMHKHLTLKQVMTTQLSCINTPPPTHTCKDNTNNPHSYCKDNITTSHNQLTFRQARMTRGRTIFNHFQSYKVK